MTKFEKKINMDVRVKKSSHKWKDSSLNPAWLILIVKQYVVKIVNFNYPQLRFEMKVSNLGTHQSWWQFSMSEFW